MGTQDWSSLETQFLQVLCVPLLLEKTGGWGPKYCPYLLWLLSHGLEQKQKPIQLSHLFILIKKHKGKLPVSGGI